MSPIFSLQHIENAVDESQGVDGVARNIEVDVQAVENSAVEGGAAVEDSSADGVGPGKYENLGVGDGVVGVEKGVRHVFGYWSCEDDAVGVSRRGDEADSETTDVEIDVASGVEFHFAAAVASGGDLSQLKGAAEESPDFGSHLVGVDNNGAVVAGADYECAAVVGGDVVVFCERDFLRAGEHALGTECASSEVDAQGVCGDGSCWAKVDERGLIDLGVGDDGAATKDAGDVGRRDVGYILFSLVEQDFKRV